MRFFYKYKNASKTLLPCHYIVLHMSSKCMFVANSYSSLSCNMTCIDSRFVLLYSQGGRQHSIKIVRFGRCRSCVFTVWIYFFHVLSKHQQMTTFPGCLLWAVGQKWLFYLYFETVWKYNIIYTRRNYI